LRFYLCGPSWDQGRALKNSPVGYFSEGASLQGLQKAVYTGIVEYSIGLTV